MRRKMNQRLLVLSLISISAVMVSGCATETRLAAHPDMPRPTWTMYSPEPSGGNRFYVGIGLAENILDETQGRRLATTNAAEQVANSIATDVEAIITQTEGREGPAHKGRDVAKGDVVARVKARSNEIVRGMNAREYYYEKWRIRDGFLRLNSFTRYKYYVLTAYPESEYNRMVNIVAEEF